MGEGYSTLGDIGCQAIFWSTHVIKRAKSTKFLHNYLTVNLQRLFIIAKYCLFG